MYSVYICVYSYIAHIVYTYILHMYMYIGDDKRESQSQTKRYAPLLLLLGVFAELEFITFGESSGLP